MNLNDWFSIGMSPQAYLDVMQEHKEDTMYIYHSFVLPDDEAFFERLKKSELRVIVLTEDWCGDAMMNVPILLRLAEAAHMPVSILQRDQNLDLMDQYLTNGKSRSIPIFIFINEKGEEVAKWGPRAEQAQRFVEGSMATLPPKEADDYEEKKQEMIMFLNKSYRDDTSLWTEVYQSICHPLQVIV